MRNFIDCEFIEDGKTIDLISIGMVADDGREFYAENIDAKLEKASQWVKDNVIIQLWSRQSDKSAPNRWIRDGGSGGLLSYKEIGREIKSFLTYDNATPEIWGEWCSYDWVAFCQLFGTMMDLPKGFPMRCRDIIQYCEDHLRIDSSELPPSLEIDGNHNALLGAKTVKNRFDWLRQQDKMYLQPKIAPVNKSFKR